MSDRPTPQPGILEIAEYIPGRSSAGDDKKTIKLSSNESPLGASPKAMAAVEAVAGTLADYPDGASWDLRDALADANGLEVERIIIGAGSDELLHMLAQAYLGNGDEAIMHEYGFLVYPIVTQAAGATLVSAKAKDFAADVDAILAAVTPKTKIVFLDNPNNPTGTHMNGSELVRLHAGLPSSVLLVVDSAYAEYVNDPDYVTGTKLVAENENVVMVRTFSKIGLAGLRIGWLYGPDHLVTALNKIRGPFNVSSTAQVAGVAAIEDKEFTAKLAAHNAKWRGWLSQELASNRLRVLPSQGNFILVLFPENEPGLSASDANKALLAEGLVVREMGGYGLPNALRISIGEEEGMQAVARVLSDFK